MNEISLFFQNRRNLVGAIVFVLLLISIPIGFSLAQRQQVFKSRAFGELYVGEGICVANCSGGSCVGGEFGPENEFLYKCIEPAPTLLPEPRETSCTDDDCGVSGACDPGTQYCKIVADADTSTITQCLCEPKVSGGNNGGNQGGGGGGGITPGVGGENDLNCVYSEADGRCFSGHTSETSSCNWVGSVCLNPTKCNYLNGISSETTCPSNDGAPLPTPRPTVPASGGGSGGGCTLANRTGLSVDCTQCLINNVSRKSINDVKGWGGAGCIDEDAVNHMCNGGTGKDVCLPVKNGVCSNVCNGAAGGACTVSWEVSPENPAPGSDVSVKVKGASDPGGWQNVDLNLDGKTGIAYDKQETGPLYSYTLKSIAAGSHTLTFTTNNNTKSCTQPKTFTVGTGGGAGGTGPTATPTPSAQVCPYDADSSTVIKFYGPSRIWRGVETVKRGTAINVTAFHGKNTQQTSIASDVKKLEVVGPQSSSAIYDNPLSNFTPSQVGTYTFTAKAVDASGKPYSGDACKASATLTVEEESVVTTKYRVSAKPMGKNDVTPVWQDYTQDPIRVNMQFPDARPGDLMTVYVQFRDRLGNISEHQKSIRFGVGDPAISNVTCTYSPAGTGTNIQVWGSNFGPQGSRSKLIVNGKEAQISSWANFGSNPYPTFPPGYPTPVPNASCNCQFVNNCTTTSGYAGYQTCNGTAALQATGGSGCAFDPSGQCRSSCTQCYAPNAPGSNATSTPPTPTPIRCAQVPPAGRTCPPGQFFATDTCRCEDPVVNVEGLETTAAQVTAMVPENVPGGTQIPVTLTTNEGKTVSSSCTIGVSTLTFVAKPACRASGDLSLDDVRVQIYENVLGAQPVFDSLRDNQKVTINSDGQPQWPIPKLVTGKTYVFVIKGPRTLGIAKVFTALQGTTSLNDILLPVGDIAPVNNPDNAINAFDKAEMSAEWNAVTDTSKPGDLTGDNRINVFDFKCLKDNSGRAGVNFVIGQ